MNLQDAFKYLNLFIPKSTSMPILKNLCIEDGYLKATNLENTIHIKTDIEGSGCIPFDTVKKALAKCKKVNPVLSLDGVNALISHDKGSLTFEGVSTEDYPSLASIFGEKEVKPVVIGESIMSAIDRARFFVHPEEHRSVSNVLLQSDAVVATDTHKLFWNDHEALDFGGDVALFAGKGNVDVAKLVVELNLNHVQRFNQTHFAFSNQDRSIVIYSMNHMASHNYPQWRNVIPYENQQYQATFATKDFVDALDRLLIVANTETYLAKTTCGLAITMTAEGPKGKNKSTEVVEVNPQGADIVIGINCKNFRACLDKAQTSETTIRVFAANQAVVVNDEMICMPIVFK